MVLGKNAVLTRYSRLSRTSGKDAFHRVPRIVFADYMWDAVERVLTIKGAACHGS